MQVKIMYFASLRDSSQVSEEVVETRAASVAELFEELNEKYQFNLDKAHLRAAKNERYVPFDAPLNQNDTVVFIPPVAGG